MQEVAEIYVAQCQYKLLFWHWNVSKKKFQSKFQGLHDLSFLCDVLKNLSILLAPNHIIHIFFSLPCLGNTSFKRLNSSGLHWFVIASWIFVNSSLAAAFCCSILSLNKNVSERVNNRTAIVFKDFLKPDKAAACRWSLHLRQQWTVWAGLPYPVWFLCLSYRLRTQIVNTLHIIWVYIKL